MSGGDRWQPRPVAALLLRGAVFAVPILVSATISVAVARAFIPARGVGGLAVRFLASFAISVVVLRIADRGARKLLPLAVLWKLTLAFPGEAPSRWKIARQAGNVAELERIASDARENGVIDEPARAAAQILSLVAAVEAHDRATRGHSERVRIYADLIAEELHLSDEDRNKLRWASLLHDVGKLMVPAEVLNKPAKLDDDEFDIVRAHPEHGMRFIEPLRDWLGEWALAVEQHHERFDGNGYPHGHSGWQIARAARIVAVADSYEVMTARRPYKRPMNAAAAREELIRCSGEQFDPAMVRAFMQISIGKLRVVSGPLAWLAQTPFLRGLESVASSAGAATAGGALALGLVPVLPVVAPQGQDPPPTVIGGTGEQAGGLPGSPTPTPPPLPGIFPSPTASTSPSPSPTPTEPEPEPTEPRPTEKPTDRPTPKPSESPTKIVTPSKSPDPGEPTQPSESPTPEPNPLPVPTPTTLGRLPV